MCKVQGRKMIECMCKSAREIQSTILRHYMGCLKVYKGTSCLSFQLNIIGSNEAMSLCQFKVEF